MTPTAAWMVRAPARMVAFGFGSGLIRPAPGTWGSLAGWAAFVLWLEPLPVAARLLLVAAAFALGVWACGRTGRELGVADHRGMVWDEVVAVWLVLSLVPPGWLEQAVGVVLFRLFDIAKPPPIRQADARLKSGLGVMVDDLLAALYVLLAFALWRLAPGGAG